MNRLVRRTFLSSIFALLAIGASAQYRDTVSKEERKVDRPALLSLEDALKIALAENVSVQLADLEIEKAGYSKKGTYAQLFPQVNGTGSYQRTIKKQVMYMDGMGGGNMFSSMMQPIFDALEAATGQKRIGGCHGPENHDSRRRLFFRDDVRRYRSGPLEYVQCRRYRGDALGERTTVEEPRSLRAGGGTGCREGTVFPFGDGDPGEAGVLWRPAGQGSLRSVQKRL